MRTRGRPFEGSVKHSTKLREPLRWLQALLAGESWWLPLLLRPSNRSTIPKGGMEAGAWIPITGIPA